MTVEQIEKDIRELEILETSHCFRQEANFAIEGGIKALELVRAIKDLMDAETTWIFDEDGNDWHVIMFEDLEEVLK